MGNFSTWDLPSEQSGVLLLSGSLTYAHPSVNTALTTHEQADGLW